MKKTLSIFLTLFSFNLYAQINIDDFYKEKSEKLIISEVIEFEEITVDELYLKVKKWAGLTFTNMNEVLVSDVKDQLVFNYISKSFYTKSLGLVYSWNWHVKMVVQIKDNKIRVLFYDNGNALTKLSSGGSVYQSKTFFFDNFFKKNGNSMNQYNDGLADFKLSLKETLRNFENSINSKNDINNNDNDW